MVDQHFRSGTMISTTFRYTGLGAATAMSVMARRLSACLPQEALVRRSSPTALDIASQISQLDAACPTLGAEDNGSAVCLETSIRPLNEENRGNSAGRRLSLDVTWLSTRVLHSDSRRASLRSPAWQQEPPSPAPEFLMQPYMLKRAASSSPGQWFFSRAWRLDEEWDEGRSPAASPPVHTNTAPYSQELLFSCPRRQQRRQSWGPTVFSPSPLSTSPVHAVSRMHCVDLLSPCAPCQQRRQCLGATVISPSPEDARCVQIPRDDGSPSPNLAASPSLLSPHYRVTPLLTHPVKPLQSPCHGKKGEGGGEDLQSRNDESVIDAERRGITRTNSRNMVPCVTIDSAVPEIPSDRSVEARLTCSHREEVQPQLSWEFLWGWGQRGPAELTSQRRASWHTTLPVGNTCVSTSQYCRRHQVGSARAGRVSLCPKLPPGPHSARPGSILGKGGFGVVKLGRYRGRGVAVKVLKGRRAAASSGREAKVLPLAQHTHIAWTLAVVTQAAKGLARVSWAHAFEKEEEMVSQQTVTAMFSLPLEDTQGCRGGEQQQGEGGVPRWAWVVSELCLPHTLLTLINDTSLTLTSEMRVRYMLDVSRGLAHLHAHGLAHRDLKPGNVLLTHSGHLKIADFGCCARLGLQDDDIVLGTVRYQAPEVLRGGVGGSHSDVFSLGVTIWHLLTRSLPYQGLHPHIVIYQVAYLNHRPPDHQLHPGPRTFLDAVLWRLAHTCWSEEHTLRPTAAALCRNLTLLHLASSPRGVSGLPDIEVCPGDSSSPPAQP
ncbi:uncharacterized protein LOC127008168 isoform X2 [Eriocheir sinensis]|uniref:uncharacterized protein LOC127008168 isoform X2 n=1 Tax=Eriocheir sinensis TaxID=95602 RepID=UPI0021C78CAD|nr:uncharacterized protein LOC127008168 isoform X2 [Eriocheir sinensis]